MNLYKQHTIARPVSFSGKGLHTGVISEITVNPALAYHGIVFRQTGAVHAHVGNVSQTNRAVTLSGPEVTVRTVEHLLAALYGLGITNADIEVSGPEIPILDGSACVFSSDILKSGLTEQSAERKSIVIRKTIVYTNEKTSAYIKFSPAKDLTVSCGFTLGNKLIQHAVYHHSPETFVSDIAQARTFGFISELRKMRQHRLITGADYDTGFIVLDAEMDLGLISDELGLTVKPEYLHRCNPFPVLSVEPPRYPDEMVRHKVLDILGDLSLCGCLIQGHVEARGTGHADHIAAVKLLLQKSI